MYCRRCGKQIPDDAAHCPSCGTPTKGDYDPYHYGEEKPDEEKKRQGEQEVYENGHRYTYSNPREYFDPVKSPGAPDDKRGWAIASLVLGILSVVLCCAPFLTIPCGIAGIVTGILGSRSSGQGMAAAGIVLSIVGVVLGIGYVIMSLLVFRTVDLYEILREWETEMYY